MDTMTPERLDCPGCEIARLRKEVEQLTKEREFQAELGCGLHEGYKLVWCGECVKVDRAKAAAVVRAAEHIREDARAYTGEHEASSGYTISRQAFGDLRLALAAYRERA